MNQSIVLCKPLTGRQHQLRVHLSYLGHPIVQDKLYNPLYQPGKVPNTDCPCSYEKDDFCSNCNNSNDRVEELWDQIYLHSYFYSVKGEDAFSCKTPFPTWATEDSSFEPKITEEHPLLSEEFLNS